MKKILLAAFLIVILAWVFVFLNFSPKPLSQNQKEQALTKILGRKPNLTDNTLKGNVMFKGKYVSFYYPAAAKIYITKLNGQVVNPTDLESLIFDLSSPKIAFFMEVVPVPITVQILNDYPGVKLRQIESNIYKQSQITAGGLNGLLFEKISNTGNEVTAFFYKNGKVYSFSSQGGDIKEVESLSENIIVTVKFTP